MTVGPAGVDDVAALAELAAETFPLACPPTVPDDDVAAFIATHLGAEHFAGYLADAGRTVLAARSGDRILGYAMLIRGEPADPVVAQSVPGRPTVELSKMYVRADAHGSGVAASLMAAAIDTACDDGLASVWLGVNQRNARAQAFYHKSGFTVCGTRTFALGAHIEQDFVLACSLGQRAPGDR
ncbi:MAG: GNAT family N-acetyltransferase [Mycolicibacterium insubricum]